MVTVHRDGLSRSEIQPQRLQGGHRGAVFSVLPLTLPMQPPRLPEKGNGDLFVSRVLVVFYAPPENILRPGNLPYL